MIGATLAVLRLELRRLFLSPVGWGFLSVVTLLGGAFFSIGLDHQGEASLRAVLPNLVATLLFCVPLLTTRQLAEEARSGALELLLTAPVPVGAVVLGKWAAAMTLCAVLLAVTGGWSAVLLTYGDPDTGALLTSYLGLLGCCAVFTAAGLLGSSVTREPVVAGVVGVGLLAPLWLAGMARGAAPEALSSVLAGLSLHGHLRSFTRGVLDTGDVAWFVGVTAIFLVLATGALGSRRWR